MKIGSTSPTALKTFKAPKLSIKVPLANPPKAMKIPADGIPKVHDRWPTEIRQESRRVTGVTPKLLGAYQESPARFIPRTKSLRAMATQKRVGPRGTL